MNFEFGKYRLLGRPIHSQTRTHTYHVRFPQMIYVQHIRCKCEMVFNSAENCKWALLPNAIPAMISIHTGRATVKYHTGPHHTGVELC